MTEPGKKNTYSSIDYRRWERVVAYCIIGVVPAVITQTTVDSYLMPKVVVLTWLTFLWIVLVVIQQEPVFTIQNAIDKPLMAFCGWCLISTLIRFKTPIQIHELLHLYLFVVLFYLFHRFWKMPETRPINVVYILIASASLLSTYGILQDIGIDFAVTTGGVRDWRSKIVSTLGNPNMLAGYLAILLPVIVGFGLRRRGTIQQFLIVGLAVLLMSLCHTLTFSVGATLSLIGGSIVMIATALTLYRAIYVPVFRTLVLLGIMAGSACWFLLDNPYNSHQGSLLEEAKQSPQWTTGFGARRFIWKTTRLMIEDKPLLGIGFANYLTVHEHYQGKTYRLLWNAHDRDYVIPVDQPHFQLIETAAELGPLGVFLVSWLSAAWLLGAIRTIRNSHSGDWFAWGCFGGVTVAAIHSFSDFPFHLPASSLSVVLLSSYLMIYNHRDQPKRLVRPSVQIAALSVVTLFSIVCYFNFLSNHELRKGIEARGLESIYHHERAKTLYPFSYQTHFLLGVAYAEQGWNEKALEAFQNALVYQEDIYARKWMSYVFQRQGRLDKAIEEMKRIIALNPVFPGHYRDLIDLYRKTDHTEPIPELERKARELEEQLYQQR